MLILGGYSLENEAIVLNRLPEIKKIQRTLLFCLSFKLVRKLFDF